MGTSGAYSGSGGAQGDALRDGIGEWLESLPESDHGAPGEPSDGSDSDADRPDDSQPRLDPDLLLGTVALIRPRASGGSASDGPGGGAGGGRATTSGGGGGRPGGGPRRSSTQSATSAGRAAAAAYAYRSGDADTLQRLGLDYGELAALDDSFEVTRRIVEAACGPVADSSIEDHEQRLVAADVAEWILDQESEGYTASPEEITRHTIALIITNVFMSETGDTINSSIHAAAAEHEIRDAAEALAGKADLSVTGATDSDFSQAIESGVETLRTIFGEDT